jgi:hypothetical protein
MIKKTPKIFQFVFWKIVDLKSFINKGRTFDLYGLRLITGRQGSGKTIVLTYMLEKYKRRYPKCKIYTNFGYINQDAEFKDWKQLYDQSFLNGEDGIIIGWDEMQNDFMSTAYKNIPEGFITQITQQRKQRICILATSQVYTRVLKALREQCFLVGEAKTFMKRWTFCKFYDASDYESYYEKADPSKRSKMMRVSKLSFIQDDIIRSLYDTYAVIKSMTSKEYIHPVDRHNQGA